MEGGTDDRQAPSTAAERAALHAVLDDLARSDRESFEQLMADNPQLATVYLLAPELQGRIHDALTHDADPVFARIIALTQEQLDTVRRQPDTPAVPLGDEAEAPGVFTELTRELSPEHAQALYRKITPLVVFEVLRTMDQSANIAVVQQIAERLCSDEVMARLRASSHVRDGIIEELCSHLGASVLAGTLDRQRLLDIMEQCGALGDVNTMANCIRLSQIRAG